MKPTVKTALEAFEEMLCSETDLFIDRVSTYRAVIEALTANMMAEIELESEQHND